MPDIFQTAETFVSQLVNQELAAAKRLVEAYGQSYKRINAELNEVLRELHDVTVSDLTYWERMRKRDRIERIRAQVAQQMDGFSAIAQTTITDQQRQAIAKAQVDAPALMGIGMGQAPPGVSVSFQSAPIEAFERLVGFTSSGSPLAELFGEFGEASAKRAVKELQAGLLLGLNPKIIATQIKRELAGNLTRALLIARTETLRAYREATRATYRANSDLVKGYRWAASFSLRTCGMCLAMHGKLLPLDKPFGTHPNCRCTMVPVMTTWADLGYDVPEPAEPVMNGEAWFRNQTPKDQDIILGKRKAEAYREGRFDLDDLIGYRYSKRWGPMRWEKSLREVLA